MMKRYWSLSFVALAIVACESPKLISPAHTAARFGRDPNAVHTLVLPTADTNAALKAWQDAINADVTHDTVWGVLPKGTITMRVPPDMMQFGSILIYNIGGASSTRVVDISGYSRDSTILIVDSAAHATHNRGGAFGFVVLDPNVHIHDLAITSHADSTSVNHPAGDGLEDEGVAFSGIKGSTYGEIHNVRIRGFRVAGIDVYQMRGVFVHDNEVFCAPRNSITHNLKATGIWMRDIAPPTPPGVANVPSKRTPCGIAARKRSRSPMRRMWGCGGIP